MGSRERREKEAAALREKIIRAARKLFDRGGYEKISMRRIAREINYSPTTIYRFFTNKEEILSAITGDTHGDLSRKFREITRDPALRPLDSLRELVRVYLRFGLENPDIYRLYISLARIEVRDQEIYETIGGKTYRIFATWQELIDRLAGEGKIRSTDSVSTVILIWSAVEGLLLNRHRNPHLAWKSDREEIDRMIAMIFEGIQK